MEELGKDQANTSFADGRALRREYSAYDPEGDRSTLLIELEWHDAEDGLVRGVGRITHGESRYESPLVSDDEWGLILKGTFDLRMCVTEWAKRSGLRVSWVEGGEDEYLYLSTEPRGTFSLFP